MNRQTDNHEDDKPADKPGDHGQVRSDEPVETDVPDEAVIEKTLPTKKIDISSGDA